MIFGRLALSIPSNAASAWLAGSRQQRPRLGVRVLPAGIPASLRGADPAIPEDGLMVAALEAGGPAEKAGLLVGDVLLGVDGVTFEGVESLLDALDGDRGRLRVMRGGKISVVDVDLEAPGRAA
jgi:S1-C subfamily serine protease